MADALPFAEDWSSQAVTVADSHPSSSIGANRIPSEWNSACGKAESSSSEDGAGRDLNEEETKTSTAVESENQSTKYSNRDSEPKKSKQTKTVYSNYQLDQLELVFSSTHYPNFLRREELASRLGIGEDRIRVWFKNKQARFRKQERSGSVGYRRLYRQEYLQKLQERQAVMGTSNFMSGSPISAAVRTNATSPTSYALSAPPRVNETYISKKMFSFSVENVSV